MREQRKNTKTDRPAGSAKKPYRAPRLSVYGDLRQITKVKGGTGGDGAEPKTRK